MPEHAHIIDCEECRIVFRVCLGAENFGAVLKQLGGENEQAGGNEDVTTREHLTSILVEVSTPSGLAMKSQLKAGFADLTCPADETCTLIVGDTPDTAGIAVLLRRQNLVRTEKPWVVDHDTQTGTYLYNALFEKESALEIVAAIKKVLER